MNKGLGDPTPTKNHAAAPPLDYLVALKRQQNLDFQNQPSNHKGDESMTKQPFRFTLFLLIGLSISVTATAQTINTNGMVRLVYFLPSDRPERPDRVQLSVS